MVSDNTFILSATTILIILVLGAPVSANSLETRLGLGSGITTPEVVSYNTRFIGEFRMDLGNDLGLAPTVRAEISPSSFIGIQVISSEVSLLFEKIDLRNITPYFGGGGGVLFMNTSLGSETSFTFHGIAGFKLKVIEKSGTSSLSPFVQAEIKSSPTHDYIWEFEIGFMYRIATELLSNT